MRKHPFTVIYKTKEGEYKHKHIQSCCAQLACIDFEEAHKDEGVEVIEAGLGRCALSNKQLTEYFNKLTNATH